MHQAWISAASDRATPRVNRRIAELEANAQELVVFCYAVGARQAPRLDLARVGRNGEVRDERVFGLPRAVADDRPIAVFGSHADPVERLGKGTDLLQLDERRLRRRALPPPARS